MRVVGIVEKERRSVEDTAAWLRAQRADWMCPDARFIVALFFFFFPFFFFLRTGLAVSLLLIASWSADWSHITHVDSRSGNHRHHYGPTGAAAYASPLVANEGQDGTFPGYWQEDAVMSHVIQCASALSLSLHSTPTDGFQIVMLWSAVKCPGLQSPMHSRAAGRYLAV